MPAPPPRPNSEDFAEGEGLSGRSRRIRHRGGHFIVCGDGPLAYRIAEELTTRFGGRVVVILPSRQHNYGPRLAALPRVRVLEHAELTSEAFTDASVQSARAVAIVWQDDVGNFHAGLRATELNPALRLVLAIFNRRLGDHLRTLFPDCTVLSGTAMSAPSFVAAALGEPAPSHVRFQRRTLYVARADDLASGSADRVLCALDVPSDDMAPPRLLPPGAVGADLVLAVADGTPRNPLTRRRDPVHATIGVLRRLIWNRWGLVFTVLLAAVVIGFALLAGRYSFSNALYLTLMDLTGSALTGVTLSGAEKTSQVLLTFAGLAAIPAVTALAVGARLTGSVRGAPRPPGDHIIVVGLGNVGTAVIGQLHDLGFDVVCIDSDPDARGMALARKLGLPIVTGDAVSEETLRAASLETCRALVSVTSSDVVNLETALEARALREDLRIVVRLTDDDLAERLQKSIGNTVSRSVSYLAAPAFAAAMLEHQVLRTIAVGRHVLLIADVLVGDQAGLAESFVRDVEQDGQSRILALQVRGGSGLDWAPPRGHLLAVGDRLIILATRAGLRKFLIS